MVWLYTIIGSLLDVPSSSSFARLVVLHPLKGEKGQADSGGKADGGGGGYGAPPSLSANPP